MSSSLWLCRACKSFPGKLRFLFFIFLPSYYSNKVNFQSFLFQLSSHLLVAVVSSFRTNELCFSCHSYFFLFFWRVSGFSIGFSHPYNNKTVCCQQVCSCHCCCIALLSVKLSPYQNQAKWEICRFKCERWEMWIPGCCWCWNHKHNICWLTSSPAMKCNLARVARGGKGCWVSQESFFMLAVRDFSKVKVVLSLPVPAVGGCQIGHSSAFLSTIPVAKRCLKFLEMNF